MFPLKLFTLGIAALFGAAASLERSETEAVIVPNTWLIVLKDDAKQHPAAHAGWANSLHEKNHGGLLGVTSVFDLIAIGTKGYTGEFTDGAIEAIRKDKDVSLLSFLVYIRN